MKANSRKGVTGRNPTPERKHCIREKEGEERVTVTAEIFSVETPKPKGTDVFFFLCIHVGIQGCLCVYVRGNYFVTPL